MTGLHKNRRDPLKKSFQNIKRVQVIIPIKKSKRKQKKSKKNKALFLSFFPECSPQCPVSFPPFYLLLLTPALRLGSSSFFSIPTGGCKLQGGKKIRPV